MLPPKPRLFKAIAILGMLLGSLGVVSSIGGMMTLSRADRSPLEALGFSPSTEAEAHVTRRMQRKVEMVMERHRKASAGLHLANGALSLLLLVGSVTLASRRTWSHAVMVQALAASGLYELPAAAHQIRLVYETMLAQRKLLPQLLHAMNQPVTADDIALTSGSFMLLGVGITIAMALLRLAYYGTGFWYLRRPDVRAWFTGGASRTSRDV